jgi:hypothetical protein
MNYLSSGTSSATGGSAVGDLLMQCVAEVNSHPEQYTALPLTERHQLTDSAGGASNPVNLPSSGNGPSHRGSATGDFLMQCVVEVNNHPELYGLSTTRDIATNNYVPNNLINNSSFSNNFVSDDLFSVPDDFFSNLANSYGYLGEPILPELGPHKSFPGMLRASNPSVPSMNWNTLNPTQSRNLQQGYGRYSNELFGETPALLQRSADPALVLNAPMALRSGYLNTVQRQQISGKHQANRLSAAAQSTLNSHGQPENLRLALGENSQRPTKGMERLRTLLGDAKINIAGESSTVEYSQQATDVGKAKPRGQGTRAKPTVSRGVKLVLETVVEQDELEELAPTCSGDQRTAGTDSTDEVDFRQQFSHQALGRQRKREIAENGTREPVPAPSVALDPNPTLPDPGRNLQGLIELEESLSRDPMAPAMLCSDMTSILNYVEGLEKGSAVTLPPRQSSNTTSWLESSLASQGKNDRSVAQAPCSSPTFQYNPREVNQLREIGSTTPHPKLAPPPPPTFDLGLGFLSKSSDVNQDSSKKTKRESQESYSQGCVSGLSRPSNQYEITQNSDSLRARQFREFYGLSSSSHSSLPPYVSSSNTGLSLTEDLSNEASGRKRNMEAVTEETEQASKSKRTKGKAATVAVLPSQPASQDVAAPKGANRRKKVVGQGGNKTAPRTKRNREEDGYKPAPPDKRRPAKATPRKPTTRLDEHKSTGPTMPDLVVTGQPLPCNGTPDLDGELGDKVQGHM